MPCCQDMSILPSVVSCCIGIQSSARYCDCLICVFIWDGLGIEARLKSVIFLHEKMSRLLIFRSVSGCCWRWTLTLTFVAANCSLAYASSLQYFLS